MIRTRFAPSPTGNLHIGGLRTALYAYALARHEEGKFILRIEDTDKKREVKGGVKQIQEILKKFNLNWDEGPFIQSERVKTGIYEKAAKRLVKDGHAYEDQGAIRLKIPQNEKISYHDFVLAKEITWDTNSLTDLVILKSDGFPTYHLAVVVDDNDMGITHVLRGHDWLPSTPIHLLIYKYLELTTPKIGHLTDILDPEGGKLSKRKGSTSVEGLLKEGYLPEAILNFVMLLGWAPKDNKEFFTLDEFIKVFDSKGFQKSNPVFNREKLDWFNGQHIRKLSDENLTQKISEFYKNKFEKEKIVLIIPLIKERIKKLSEFNSIAGFFFENPKVDKKLFGKNYRDHIPKAIEGLTNNKELIDIAKENNFKVGDFFMDLRVAVTGNKVTPPFNESIEILGHEKTLERLRIALK
ncbi:MAG: glutamate--tRNA ligase [Candidatus Woesebacteria bacterium]|nr:MAG: glutamate--tRNA ligase [Candidatus Woesebacteria bacterium]